MAVNLKLGVDMAGFRNGIANANAQLKTFDAQMKLAESTFKATGKAEEALTTKTNALNGKLSTQKQMVQQYTTVLKAMKDNGVSPLSKEYQQLETQLLKVQAGMMDTEAALNDLNTTQLEAASSADKLVQNVNGIGKKISLDQVISGIGTITNGLETAAKKAISLGEAIWTNVMDSAKWADDAQTMAMMYGIDMDTYLRVEKLVQNGLDTSVDAILKSQTKLKKGIGSGSDSIMQTMKELGLTMRMVNIYGEHFEQLATYDPTEMFWRAGQAIMELGDEYEQEAKAQELFGKSWRELIPLFTQYHSQEEFSKALEDVNVVSEEEVSVLADLNDKVSKLKGNFDTLETKVMAGLAPALTAGAEAISTLLDKVLQYLDTPEGKQMLDDMSTAVSGLFTDLSNIDPEQVVEGFTGVFDKIIGGMKWLDENKGILGQALIGIVGTWGTAKILGGALEVVKLVEGLKGLTTLDAADGTAAGAAWGGAFANAVLAAAPWLVGLYTMLNPAETGNNDLFANGQLTPEGWADVYENPDSWIHETALEVGELFGDLGNILNDANAINAMARYRNGGTLEAMIAELQALGYVLKVAEELPVAETSGGGTLGLAEGPIIHKRRNGETVIDHIDYDGPLMTIEPVRQMDLAERMGPITKDARKQLQTIIEDLNEEETAALFDPLVLPAEVEVPDDSAEKIAEDIGTVTIPGRVIVEDVSDEEMAALFGSHANGLWSVPRDNYLAMLHKGERVMPAREVASRSFSSNLYVESMYMNNGTDANGLAAAMAAAQKRTMTGFGS